jgi:peroxiredoxin (alkyl hydroperoxide reductase subunit C)
LAAVAASHGELVKLGAQVLSMSTDSRFVHKIWNEAELSKMVEGGIPFPMLSDAGGRVGRVYGVYDGAAGVNIRGRFLIDPDGVIQAMEVLTPSVGRHIGETIRQLKAFQSRAQILWVECGRCGSPVRRTSSAGNLTSVCSRRAWLSRRLHRGLPPATHPPRQP